MSKNRDFETVKKYPIYFKGKGLRHPLHKELLDYYTAKGVSSKTSYELQDTEFKLMIKAFQKEHTLNLLRELYETSVNSWIERGFNSNTLYTTLAEYLRESISTGNLSEMVHRVAEAEYILQKLKSFSKEVLMKETHEVLITQLHSTLDKLGKLISDYAEYVKAMDINYLKNAVNN